MDTDKVQGPRRPLGRKPGSRGPFARSLTRPPAPLTPPLEDQLHRGFVDLARFLGKLVVAAILVAPLCFVLWHVAQGSRDFFAELGAGNRLAGTLGKVTAGLLLAALIAIARCVFGPRVVPIEGHEIF